MFRTQSARTSVMWLGVTIAILARLVAAPAALAIEPRPAATNALWSGETWGELQVTPAITKAANSFTARAIVRGGAAGNSSWHCSQYSAWVAAGTSSINIVIPEVWSFTSGEGFIRAIGGRVMVQESSAGDPPPYGWEDRVSDTCYCYVSGWGANGGCETREVKPTFASTHQQEILASGASGEWVRIQADFGGWNGVGWNDSATAYVYIIDASAELSDADDDGLADEWEIAHFGDLVTANESTSYDDGDDVDDFTEFQRWNKDTRDGDGRQYDPTAQNSEPGNAEGGGNACGSSGPLMLVASSIGLTLLGAASRHRRPMRRAPA